MKCKLVLIGLSLVAALKIVAANTFEATSIATSKAKVVNQISISNTGGQILDFGSIAVGSVNSTIRITPSSSVSPNVLNGGDAFVLNLITQTAAKFTVTGDIGLSYLITLPNTIQVKNGIHQLDVENFTSSNGLSGVISASEIFYVGADLIIPSNAELGTYSASFNVIVSYN